MFCWVGSCLYRCPSPPRAVPCGHHTHPTQTITTTWPRAPHARHASAGCAHGCCHVGTHAGGAARLAGRHVYVCVYDSCTHTHGRRAYEEVCFFLARLTLSRLSTCKRVCELSRICRCRVAPRAVSRRTTHSRTHTHPAMQSFMHHTQASVSTERRQGPQRQPQKQGSCPGTGARVRTCVCVGGGAHDTMATTCNTTRTFIYAASVSWMVLSNSLRAASFLLKLSLMELSLSVNRLNSCCCKAWLQGVVARCGCMWQREGVAGGGQ